MQKNLVSAALATVLAAALPALAHAQAAAGKVRVTITAVKASPAADGATDKVVPAELEKFAAKLKRLPFGRYESAGTTEKVVGFGETLTVAFAGTGKFLVTAAPKAADGVTLSFRELAPGATEPCLETEAGLAPGQTHITFCDGVPEKATTFVFLSSAQATAP